jgi:hypothetical protein
MVKCAYVSMSNNQGKQDTSSAHFFLVIRYRNKTVDDEWRYTSKCLWGQVLKIYIHTYVYTYDD